MTWAAVFALLRRAPREAWWLLVVVSALAASLWSIQRYGDRRYADGKRDAARGAVFDSTLAARVRARVETLTVSTDSAAARAKRSARAVRTIVDSMPPEVKALPDVAPLVTECTSLAARADSAFHALDIEREARQMQEIVHASALRAATVVITAVRDSNAVLAKRPTRRQQIITTVGGFLVGVLVTIAGAS